jgi:hypothetical protein
MRRHEPGLKDSFQNKKEFKQYEKVMKEVPGTRTGK